MTKQAIVYDGIAICPTKEQSAYSIGQCESGAYSHAPNTSTSGYYDLEEVIPRLAEGGYAIDKRNLPWESVRHVISGPMESCNLPPLTADRWGRVQTFTTYCDFLAWAAEVKAKGGNLSMSYISLDLYAEYWHRLGARVGRKVKGEIVWNACTCKGTCECIAGAL